jgi:hypothetical protein
VLLNMTDCIILMIIIATYYIELVMISICYMNHIILSLLVLMVNHYHTSQNDNGDDHLSSTIDDTRIDFTSDTSNSMIVYDDDDSYNQNDYDYDIHTITIDDDHTTDSVYSVKEYGIAEKLNVLKRLKTSVYASNILEQLHHKYGHMSAGAIKRAIKYKMIIHDNIVTLYVL